MARSKVLGRFGTGAQAAWGVALAFLLFSAALPSSHAQMPLKARDALQKGNAAYSKAEYESAAIYYGQALANQKELTQREVSDLQQYIKRNNDALQLRRDGKLQLARAQELVQQGKVSEAGRYLDSSLANQYLGLQDRQTAERLKQQMQKSSAPTMPNGPRGYPEMLKMSRQALQRGDYAQARMWAQQAQKERPRWGWGVRPSWLGGDNPDRILHEIQVAEQKAMQGMNPMPNPKGSSSPFGPVKQWFRGRENPPQPEFKGNNGPVNVPVNDGPVLSPPSGSPNSSSSAMPKESTANRSEPDASGIQRVSASFPQVEPNMSRAECNAKARELMNRGYEALRAKDYDTARKCAYQAKELRPDFEYWQSNPDKLLAEIQRAAPTDAAPEVMQIAASTAPQERVETASGKGNARELLKQARAMFKEKKLDDADKLCAQAAGVPGVHWGLFEDSPEKLRGEIQKVRGRRDREESVRLLAEARKLHSLGRSQEAKNLAWRAQQLHGPYSIWDLGDRPQKLLAEIERAEANGSNPHKSNTTNHQADDKSQSALPSQTLPSQASMAANGPRQAPAGDPAQRGRAMALLAEARDLQNKGMLIEARQRALAAHQLNAPFGPDEDSPVNALRDLAGQCDRQVEALLHRATETVGAASDPARFEKANADLVAARNIAAAFGQDLTRIDQRAGWVQQAQASVGVGPPPVLPDAAPQTPVDPNQQVGRDKLAKALDELRAGNTHTARRLAVEAYEAKYGVQKEAVAMLNSIDAEEHNQSILAAHNNALAALEAFKRKDYRIAQNILSRVDARLLNPQMQNVVRELSASREMQPQDLQVAAAQEPNKASAPGQATVGDLPRGNATAQADDLTEKFRGMEDIVFQKLRLQSLEAQRKALDLFGAGQNVQAIELLQDCVDQLGRSQLDADRMALLKKPIENRIQQYRVLHAQKVIFKEGEIQRAGNWDEGKYQMNIMKTQEEVANLMKQYRALMKEGKFKDAGICARKALDLDPENSAAQSAQYIASVRLADDEWKKNKGRNEAMFLDQLSNDYGLFPTKDDPIAFDQNRTQQAQKRKVPSNFPAQMHNPVERAIEQKLAMPVASLNFKDTPLKQVIADLHMLTGLNIVPDTEALQAASVSLDQPLNLMVENISLKSALSLLLKQVHLTYVIKHEVLSITTENNSRGQVRQVVYGVADLVVPVDDNPLPETNSLSAALERQIAAAGASANMGVMPGPYSLPGGQNVSAMGAQPGNGAITPGGANVQKSSPRTIEDLLINLIQTTVAPDSWSSVGGPGVIQYFPLGMALIVNQTQDVQEQVQDLLAALRKLQDLEVSIEMRLVSVSEAFFERIGVDFDMNFLTHNSQAVQNQLLTGQFQPQGVINRFTPSRFVSGLTPAGVFTPDLNIPINATSFGMSVPPFGGYPGTLNGDGGLALGLAFLSDIQVFMFMEAAQGDRRTNVMQAPKITVFNGQTAFITVQDQQFFLIGVQFVPTPFGNIIFNPQQTPFPLGVSLRVTPVVSADRRFVRMNLQPQMTNLASTNVPLIPVQLPIPTTVLGPGTGTTSGPPEAIFQMFFQQPTFTQIFLSTTVNVPDGGTVLLGGLKTLSEARNEFGPPILSKLPYISRLFKNVGYGKEAQSLMIMVTPRIIINEEEEQIYIGALPPIPRF